VLAGEALNPQPSTPLRLALYAEDGTMAASVADLSQVFLSNCTDVDLLDRTHVQSILNEHSISLENRTSGALAVVAGRALVCDMLATVEVVPVEKSGEVICVVTAFQVETGARLCDVMLPAAATVEDAAMLVSEEIVRALTKCRSVLRGDAQTVSLCTIRSIDLSAGQAHIPEEFGTILERRLLVSPEICILERERLGQLLEEMKLRNDVPTGLRGSAFILDLDVSKGDDEGVQFSANLQSLSGGDVKRVAVEGDPQTLWGLADDLSSRIAKTLNACAPAAADPECLVQEAELLLLEPHTRIVDRSRYTKFTGAACVLLEAAVAADPHYTRAWGRLSIVLDIMAESCADIDRKLSLLERQLEAIRAANFIGTACTIINTINYGRLTDWTVPQMARFRALQTQHLELRLKHRRVVQLKDIRNFSHSSEEALGLVFKLRDRISPDDYYMSQLASFGYLWASLTGACTSMRGCEGCFIAYELSDDGKRLLFDFCKLMANDEHATVQKRMPWFFNAALVPGLFPQLFEAPDKVKELLLSAQQLALESPHKEELFAICLPGRYAIDQQLDLHQIGGTAYANSPKVNLPFPAEVVVSALCEIYEEVEAKTGACPETLMALDWWDRKHGKEDGYYLSLAYDQIRMRSEAVPQSSWEGIYKKLRSLFRKRYGVYPKWPAIVAPPIDSPIDPSIASRKVTTFTDATICAGELRGDKLYLLVETVGLPRALEIRCVDIVGGTVDTLASHPTQWPFKVRGRTYHKEYPLPKPPGMSWRLDPEWKDVPADFHITEEQAFVPTTQGLIVMPLNGGEPWTLNSKDGLPSDIVDACTRVGNHLYISCSREKTTSVPTLSKSYTRRDAGYFYKADLRGGALELLACSIRAETVSGLDNCKPYRIRSITHDEPNNRLILHLDEWMNLGELWAYDLNSGCVSEIKLKDLGKRQGIWIEGFRLLNDGNYLVANMPGDRAGGGRATVRYFFWNTLTDKATRLGGPLEDDTYKGSPDDGWGWAGHDWFVPLDGWSVYTLMGVNKWVVESAQRVKDKVRYIAPLEGEIPFFLRKHGSELLAVTASSVWLIPLDALEWKPEVSSEVCE